MRAILTVLGIGIVLIFSMIGLLLCAPAMLFMAAEHRNERRAEELREFQRMKNRIVEHVDAQGGNDVYQWEDLAAAGVVTKADRRLCSKRNVAYQPISSVSPANAIVFEPTDGQGTLWHKDGSSEPVWLSPNGKLAIFNTQRHQAGGLEFEFQNRTTGDVIGTWKSDANIDVIWRPDCRALAIEDGHRGGSEHVHAFVLGRKAVIEVPIPHEVSSASMLDNYEKTFPRKWCVDLVSFDEWQDELLKVRTLGQAWILDPQDEIIGSVHLKYIFSLQLSENGARVVDVQKLHHRRCGKNHMPTERFD